MKLFLYIQIKAPLAISFGNPLASWLKENLPDFTQIEADNHSEDLVIQQELKMIDEASHLLVWLDVQPEDKPGKAVRLLERVLRKHEGNPQLFLSGENALISRMLKVFRVPLELVEGPVHMKEALAELGA